jgi:hypothetical protein
VLHGPGPVTLEKVVFTFMGIIIMSPSAAQPGNWALASPTATTIRASELNRTSIFLTIPKSSFY